MKYTAERAFEECLLMWEWLAENSDPSRLYYENKERAVEALHREGKLLFDSYFNDCAFCELDRRESSGDGYCDYCPWNMYIDSGRGCLEVVGPYGVYEVTPTKENAAKVRDFILKIKEWYYNREVEDASS